MNEGVPTGCGYTPNRVVSMGRCRTITPDGYTLLDTYHDTLHPTDNYTEGNRYDTPLTLTQEEQSMTPEIIFAILISIGCAVACMMPLDTPHPLDEPLEDEKEDTLKKKE